MDKIKAVVTDAGSTGHITIKEVDPPTPLPFEALVRVSAVSLNLGEVRMAQSADDGGRIGWDLAGTVEKAAADGSGPAAGARVVGMLSRGAWAEIAAVPTNALAELPNDVSFTDAATLPVAGLTALYAVERGSGLIARRALVTGANGGVGIFACQIAKIAGAEVVAQVRRDQYKDLVTSFGADQEDNPMQQEETPGEMPSEEQRHGEEGVGEEHPTEERHHEQTPETGRKMGTAEGTVTEREETQRKEDLKPEEGETKLMEGEE